MDITVEDFEKAPSYLNFYIFVNAMITRGFAGFSKHNEKIINLTPSASNFFSIARDQDMKPFLGIPEEMLEWFFDLDWTNVYYLLNKKESRIYLESTDPETGNINFILGLKIKRKRIIVLHDEKNEKLGNTFCNMKVIKVKENGEILTSFNNLISELPIKKIKKESDIIEEDRSTDLSESMGLRFVKSK